MFSTGGDRLRNVVVGAINANKGSLPPGEGEECRSGLDAAQKSDASWDFNTVSCCDLQRAA